MLSGTGCNYSESMVRHECLIATTVMRGHVMILGRRGGLLDIVHVSILIQSSDRFASIRSGSVPEDLGTRDFDTPFVPVTTPDNH